VIHSTLAPGIEQDAFCHRRPQPGVCIQKSGDGIAKLVAWNEKFSGGDPRYPKIDPRKMDKGTLAATHLNMTLRCFKQGVVSCITGILPHHHHHHRHQIHTTTTTTNWTGKPFLIDPADLALQGVVERGHLFWVLSDKITEAEAVLVSEWRNSDNNTTQVPSCFY